MRKAEFMKALKGQLEFLNKNELEEVVGYYDELIQDAVDHGETEREFIESLGDVNDIAYNIKKDGTFLEKVRARAPFSVKEVFGLTVKIVGYFFFAIFTIVMFSIGFSIVVSGVSVAIGGIYLIITTTQPELVQSVLAIGVIVLGIGLTVFGAGIFQWYGSISKNTLKRLLYRVRDFIKE